MRVPIIAMSTLLLASTAFGGDDSSRAKLMGKWQQSGGNGEVTSAWDLEEGSTDSIHVTYSSGGRTLAEFECNTVGKECAVQDGGRKSKVWIYFNGPRLVEMETRGSRVVKRRFSITGEGDTMDLETIPIAPAGKVETSHFKRVSPVIAKQ